jgi:alpha-tubulin suppressor-like RCC1 family protein
MQRSIVQLCLLLSAVACEPFAGPRELPPLNDAPGAVAWTAVSAGTYNSCALTVEGRLYCWGFDFVDTCPLEHYCIVFTVPTRVAASGPEWKAVSIGGQMGCALSTDDDVYCWGDYTKLGDGITTRSRAPVRAALSAKAVQVTAGFTETCALLVDGTIECWGRTALPTKIDTPVQFKRLSSGEPQCAIAENDDAYCWGGGYGKLGVGAQDVDCQYGPSCLTTIAPLLVVGGHKWTDISVGTVAACGVTTDHRAFCWGEMYGAFHIDPPYGILGGGKFVGSKSPAPVAGDLQFNTVTVGVRHACGLSTTGEAWCWGGNDFGTLGTGTSASRVAVPGAVAGGLRYDAISAGEVSCAISQARNLFCWGEEAAGMLGNGSNQPYGRRSTPVRAGPPVG